MPDLNLPWSTDFTLSPTGDLATVDGDEFLRQRITRRLMTEVFGYVWHKSYGAGLPQKIGSTYQPQQIAAIVRAQRALEESVTQDPPPSVIVSRDANNPGMQVIDITYKDSGSGEQIGITITV